MGDHPRSHGVADFFLGYGLIDQFPFFVVFKRKEWMIVRTFGFGRNANCCLHNVLWLIIRATPGCICVPIQIDSSVGLHVVVRVLLVVPVSAVGVPIRTDGSVSLHAVFRVWLIVPEWPYICSHSDGYFRRYARCFSCLITSARFGCICFPI